MASGIIGVLRYTDKDAKPWAYDYNIPGFKMEYSDRNMGTFGGVILGLELKDSKKSSQGTKGD